MTELVCEICKGKYKNGRALSRHLIMKHKFTKDDIKKYYDKYLRKDKEGICIYCGKETTFLGITNGYSNKYCSSKCVSRATREQAKETIINKYGSDTYFKTEDFKNKFKKTMMKKYGVDNPMKSPDILKKAENTNLKKYGYKTSLLNEEIKEKIKNSNLKKYGVDNPMNSKIVVDKFNKKTKLQRYQKIKERLSQSNDKELLVELNDYIDLERPLKFKCLKCGTEFMDKVNNGLFPVCPNCEPKKSRFENEIYQYISKIYNIEKIILNSRKQINNNGQNELDIYLPEYKLAIEADGLYWHSELFLDKNYHLNKTISCEEKGIQLFHIFENEWLDPIKQDIWKSIISSKLNKNKRIYARDTIVKEISIDNSISFLNENHLQGGLGAKYHIGLFYKDELVSVATFGRPRFNFHYDYELLRFANKKYTNVIGGFSKLLKYFERKYNPANLITYADRRLSNGNLYEKIGFKFLRNTDPNYFYTKDFNTIQTRHTFQKHKLKNLLENYDPNLSEHENMLNNNYVRIYDCGNKVYELQFNILKD